MTTRRGATLLTPWGDDDLEVLVRNNTPEMMTHPGGPESPEQVRARHERYLRIVAAGEDRMFRIDHGDTAGVGAIGCWRTDEEREAALEAGWAVQTAWQGRGIATDALRLLVAEARSTFDRAELFAYPAVDNIASNAVCRSVGFEKLGERDDEYPPGNPMRLAMWRFSLRR